MANRPMAKGVWVEDTGLNQNGLDAKKAWRKERDRLRTERAERRERPVPNRICYAEEFAKWRPRLPLPRCKRCDATLFPEANHKCEGFVKKYVDHDDEWRKRAEARRAEMREAIHEHYAEMREERIRDRWEEEQEEMPSFEELEEMEEERLNEIQGEYPDAG
jgi:hypothetical protein